MYITYSTLIQIKVDITFKRRRKKEKKKANTYIIQ